MRLDQPYKQRSIPWKWIFIGLILLALILLAIKFWPTKPSNQESYFCDAEKFTNGEFTTAKTKFTTSCTQTKEESASGNASCLCAGDKRFGPTIDIPDLNYGDTIFYKLKLKSVKSKSRIVVSSDKDYYQEFPLKASNEWSEAAINFPIPPENVGAVWRIYPYLIKGEAAYYDDIEVLTAKSSEPIEEPRIPKFEMQINDANYNKVKAKRKEALGKGLLFASKNDLVDSDLRIDGQDYSCQVRLKGDLLDHLQGDKWSFRVVLDKGQTWAGMNIFSIHNSKARSHLAEWFMHELMRREGILSPQYDFIKFSLNKRYIGTYAYEQHFDNYFLSENQKPIGPILKHNDDGFWDNIDSGLKAYEWVASSQIELFNKENEGTAAFDELYNYGHSQLYNYIKEKKSAAEVFDLEKMARYYALIEIGHGLHAQQVTNIRFYVNPANGLLEPIGFDFFGDYLPKVTEHWRPVGMWENGKDIHERSRDGKMYQRSLFANKTFYAKYMKYLELYSAPEYISSRQEELQQEINTRTAFINQDTDYKGYKFDTDKVFAKAKFTRAKLYPLEGVSLVSYRSKEPHEVQLQSYHYFPLKVIAYTTKDGRSYDLEKPIVLDPYSPQSDIETYSFVGVKKPETISYQVLGLDKKYVHVVNNDFSPVELVENVASHYSPLSGHQQISQTDNVLESNSELLIIDQPYLVKNDETLILRKGLTVEFRGAGSLTVDGNVSAHGSQSEPISFKGTGIERQSILIRGEEGEHSFEFCNFHKLSGYRVGVIKQAASINVHNAEVYFTNCNWVLNDAKANLAVTNSNYYLTNCSFDNSSGDAIKAIFSVGKFEKIRANNFGRNFLSMQGGSVKGGDIELRKILGTALRLKDYAMLNFSMYKIFESNSSIIAEGQSEVFVGGYRGKTANRDIEVISQKGQKSRVILAGVPKGQKLKYLSSPGSLLKINGSKKFTK